MNIFLTPINIFLTLITIFLTLILHILCQRIRIASPILWTYSDVLFLAPFLAHILDIICVKICSILGWLLHRICNVGTYFMFTNTYCQPHSLNIFRCLTLSTILSTYSWHHFLWKYVSILLYIYICLASVLHILCSRMQKPPPEPSRQ